MPPPDRPPAELHIQIAALEAACASLLARLERAHADLHRSELALEAARADRQRLATELSIARARDVPA